MMYDDHGALLRIGSLARISGLSTSTLRSWETRYGLPRPERSVGGHRLYSSQSLDQVRRVQELVALGASTSAAAASVMASTAAATRAPLDATSPVPLNDLLARTHAARSNNHELRARLQAATARATDQVARLHATMGRTSTDVQASASR